MPKPPRLLPSIGINLAFAGLAIQAAWLASCAAIPEPNQVANRTLIQSALGSGRPGNPAGEVARKNALFTNDLIARERTHYSCDAAAASAGSCSTDPDGLPRLCIALSGGGVRSAAFSMGVMQALASEGLADAVDIVSATSGGSYLLSWMMITKLNAEIREQRSLTMREALAVESIAARQFRKPGVACVIPTPFALLTGVEAVSGFVRATENYQVAIGDAFLSSFESGVDFRNRIDGGSTLSDIRTRLDNTRFPVPIIVATGRTDEQGGRCATPSHRPLLRDSILEMTPRGLRFGADVIDGDLPLRLSDLSAMAGAAISDPYAENCELREALNVSLGQTRDFSRNGHPPRLFVTDGGFAENLAVYPLVQRLCSTIVAVDGEHDPNMKFEGFRRLAVALTAEAKGSSEQSLVACPVPNDSLVKAPAIEASMGNCAVRGNYAGDLLKVPVSVGSIGPYPFTTHDSTGGETYTERTLRLIYVKLGLDGEVLNCAQRDQSAFAVEYCSQTAQGRRGCAGGSALTEDCTFPQQSTAHQCFSAGDFEAYRSLGENHGRIAAEIIRHPSSR